MPADSTPEQLLLSGTPVVPGTVLAPALTVSTELDRAAVRRFDDAALSDEAALVTFDAAVEQVSAAMSARAAVATGSAAEVLTASAKLARDKGLRAAVAQHVAAGTPLLSAIAAAVDQFAGAFGRAGGLVAERVADLRDIERRVIARVVGLPEPGGIVARERSVLVATDLAPADTAGLDGALVAALVIEKGGPTSHTAIIARQLGIPCVVGVTGAGAIPAGAPVLVDGSTGEVCVAPEEADARARVARARGERAAVSSWTGPAATSDGTRVKLLANVADVASARDAAAAPVDGVGLFRTELPFLDRHDEPSVEEQANVYAAVLAVFGHDRPVVVRTLDAGSDKPIGFATPLDEGNPALGVRGLRLAIGNPGLLDRQLEAVALAARRTGTRPWVMAPMVATVAEAADFADRVRSHGLPAGVMVEIPSAALLAHKLVEVVDFLSLGTNDLAQYTMAADRTAGDLAHLTDPWQPAVLSLVAMTAEAGRRAGKPVGVCGEAAADPLLAATLVGMGVTSLSMAAAAVRPVGARLATVSIEQCVRAAEVALAASDPVSARADVRRVLAHDGFGETAAR